MMKIAIPERCDVLIHSGRVVDGTGGPARDADVAIEGDRVLAVAPGMAQAVVAGERIDASARVVSPGFIDAHTHDDRAVLSSPDMTAKVSQGVTTVVTGNCGVSLAPLLGDAPPPPPMTLLGGRDWYRFDRFGDYLAAVEAEPPALNVAPLVGHTALRASVMDDVYRAATLSEIGAMEPLLDEALEAGCIGMSTGLAYPPAIEAPTDEVVALARRLADHRAIYTTHMRDEGLDILASIEETLSIGARAEIPVVISHHKCSGREAWGLSRETLAAIERARGRQTVDLDVYPYVASSTVLIADWVDDAEKVLVTWSTPHPEMNGRELSEIAEAWGLDIAGTVERLLPAGAIYFKMDEADLRRILAFEDAMVGSDGLPHDAVPHPRLWGTFPRVLGHYARDLGLLSLEEAVRRMSAVAARVFGLEDRGVLAPGAFADVVVFDPDTVHDAATFEHPTRPATGIERVLVNGVTVWEHGEGTSRRPGRVLRRRAA